MRCLLSTVSEPHHLSACRFFLPLDNSPKRGIAIVSCPSVRLSVTLMYRDRTELRWFESDYLSRPL